MAQSDLLTRRSVMDTIKKLFFKYKMAYKPESDPEKDGFAAELPQVISQMTPEYDVEQVIQNIKDGQSLNIPHQGYCINKDMVIDIVKAGLEGVDTSYDKPEHLSDDIDKAISWFALHSICRQDCVGKNCIDCVIYHAKKNAIIALNFYNQVENMLTRIQYLKEHSSDDAQLAYSEVEKLFKEAYDYANDRSHMS